jgi:hypothetical protein
VLTTCSTPCHRRTPRPTVPKLPWLRPPLRSDCSVQAKEVSPSKFSSIVPACPTPHPDRSSPKPTVHNCTPTTPTPKTTGCCYSHRPTAPHVSPMPLSLAAVHRSEDIFVPRLNLLRCLAAPLNAVPADVAEPGRRTGCP